MKIVKLTAIVLCFILTGTVYADVPGGAFLMSPGSNKAYFYNGKTTEAVSFYKDRKSGCPYLGSDGNVYISAKSFFGMFGEGNEYFKDDDNLVIIVNGKKCIVPIGKKFAVRNREKDGNMYIYPVEDDFYIPSKLVAMMCGGNSYYDEKTKELIFFTDSSVENNLIFEGKLSEGFWLKQVPYTFMNSTVKHNLYLKSDGLGIESVDKSQCVFRLGETLYYIMDYIMYVKKGDGKPEQMYFYDAQRIKNDIRIYTAINIGGKIFGTATGNAFGKTGRVFMCDTDGYNFRYIGTATAANLVHSVADSDYLYYMSSSKNPQLFMYDVEHEDEYEITVIDKNNNSLLNGMTKFAVTDNGMFSIINDTKIRFIEFERPAYECEWIKIYDDECITDISSYAYGTFTEITVLNFDSINNNLYLVDKNKSESRVIRIGTDKFDIEVLGEFEKDITNINIFNTLDGIEILAVFSDGSTENLNK